MASNGDALVGLWFDGQRHFPSTLLANAVVDKLPVFELAIRWLDIYFSGNVPDFMPPIKMQGTEFRMDVWKILLEIPFGKTISYGEIASRLASERGVKAMSAQAVGGAVGHNPISLIVPCHRVVGSNGKLIGYGGGIQRKIALLEMEGAWRQAPGLTICRPGNSIS